MSRKFLDRITDITDELPNVEVVALSTLERPEEVERAVDSFQSVLLREPQIAALLVTTGKRVRYLESRLAHPAGRSR